MTGRSSFSFFSIGMCDPDHVGEAAPHHNCRFRIDQRGLLIALEMELAVYLTALEKAGDSKED